jgi:hypothetical protein
MELGFTEILVRILIAEDRSLKPHAQAAELDARGGWEWQPAVASEAEVAAERVSRPRP